MNSKYNTGDKAYYLSRDPITVIEVETVSQMDLSGYYEIRILSSQLIYNAHERELIDHVTLELKPLECECGKEKHGFASHTHWCQIKE